MNRQKECSKCGKCLPATTEYFHKNATGKYGLNARCKKCVHEYQIQNKQRMREQRREYEARPEVRERIRKYDRKRYTQSEVKKKKYKYNAQPENKEHKRKYKREYHARPKVKEQMAEYSREYYQRPEVKERNKIYLAKRVARKRSLSDNYTLDDWQYALDYFNGCCAVCGRQLNDLFGTHTAAQDHWIPLSSKHCIGTVPQNIVPLCHGRGGCNNRKREKHPVKWLQQEFTKREAKEILNRVEVFFLTVRNVQIEQAKT